MTDATAESAATARAARYDAFLSHSKKDAAFVRDLHARLTRDGVRCFFDEVDLPWGVNFALALEEALAASGRVVVVLSPDFVRSEWTALERSAAMIDDPAGLRRRVLPILLRDCDAPAFLRPIQRLDCRAEGALDACYPTILRVLRAG